MHKKPITLRGLTGRRETRQVRARAMGDILHTSQPFQVFKSELKRIYLINKIIKLQLNKITLPMIITYIKFCGNCDF